MTMKTLADMGTGVSPMVALRMEQVQGQGHKYSGSVARLSDCGRYRWFLARSWLVGRGTVCFVMLNPSTADGNIDDRTVRRCVSYGQSWGYQRLTVVNLFGWRSTDPSELYRVSDPVGSENDKWIIQSATTADLLVCAWGIRGQIKDQSLKVLDRLVAAGVVPFVLALTDGGFPAHPLYLPARLRPKPFDALKCLVGMDWRTDENLG